MSTGISQFQRSYEIAPIVLVNGIARNMTNGQMSILALTEGRLYLTKTYTSINQYFARYKIMSGSTLQHWEIAQYPFLNMVMAANAVVQMPLRVSLMMLCPAQTNTNTYAEKTATISSLKINLDAHISQGGAFHVATPGYTYQNCLLTELKDVTQNGDKQVQLAYQWEFVQPLITTSQAIQQLNAIYAKLSGGLPTPDPVTNSGKSNVIGNNLFQQPTGFGSQPGNYFNLPSNLSSVTNPYIGK